MRRRGANGAKFVPNPDVLADAGKNVTQLADAVAFCRKPWIDQSMVYNSL
jgi:hypothetical protein